MLRFSLFLVVLGSHGTLSRSFNEQSARLSGRVPEAKLLHGFSAEALAA